MPLARIVLGMVLLGMVVLATGVASAQDYPGKPIRVISPGPGGGADFVARYVAQGISGPLGQQVVVENRPAGVIPGQIVSKAPPDGYTLMVNGNSFWIAPLMRDNVPYDPVKDFCSSPFRFTDPYYLDSARKAEKECVLAWARESMKRRLDASRVSPEFVEWYANEMGKTSPRVVVETHDALVGNDLSDILRRIKVPTLLLSAESRPGYTWGYVQEMEQLIEGSKLVVFPGTFGFVHQSEPEKCAETVLAFLHGL
ncbi:MAG: hypothetical protein A3G24_26310 [Betaproteobacteria bacterium RIFCSPLOWO2_12_FULL_62_13]|nr:MAG: hypothetical protein A3G24_26310 [Betaproteobacteria bacterium RIFCSPLOWO2_12_FULL_62_13]